jgi:hypothetical protein
LLPLKDYSLERALFAKVVFAASDHWVLGGLSPQLSTDEAGKRQVVVLLLFFFCRLEFLELGAQV